VDTSSFFKMGWNLIARGDAGTRQYIITKLGAETGLVMVKALADLMADGQVEETTVSIFKDRTLPFYRIISHPEVLSSLILETPLDCIYNFLFGPSGRRGLGVFRFTATAISGLVLSHPLHDEEFFSVAVTSSLAVLQRLVDVNQSAQVIDDFVPIVETISACISEQATLPSARQSLIRIRRRLNIGASLPLATRQSTVLNFHYDAFELSQDLPGKLSDKGPRHDNDHEKISDIQILPTAQEITSQRQEYLPSNNPTKHHLPGLSGLLDRQFRLLREDTVGQLRDAVRIELSRLEHPSRLPPGSGPGVQVVRNVVYKNVRLLRLDMDRQKGLQIVAGFDQPPSIQNKPKKQREEFWKNSKLLQVDALVCFVSATGRVIFFSVCDPSRPPPVRKQPDSEADASKSTTAEGKSWRPSDDLPSLFREADQATVLLSMVEHRSDDVAWITHHLGTRRKSGQSLVEFPGVLLASFQSTLQALQNMSRTLDLPFAEIIAPDTQSPNTMVMQPPAYAQRRGFGFNLSCLTGGEPLVLTPGKRFDFEKLRKNSTLDDAQQVAVVQALGTGLAFIQGPPGTGKSYTGVNIIKALLSNRKAAELGPIICVCFTNHALDQLLEHLLKDGVKQIIRLGSRSKSEILQEFNLQQVAKEIEVTRVEKHEKWQHNRDRDEEVEETKDLLSGLNNPTSWENVRDYLQKASPGRYKELFGNGVDEDGFREVRGRRYKVVDGWLRGAPKKISSNRSVPELSSVPLKEMSASERTALHKHWIQDRINELNNDLLCSLDSFHASKSALDKCHQELDLRCLLQSHVIGVTTTGLARKMDVLRRVRAKVIICEEAGEVLEAHILTALLPGVEHAILIGDHEQLRPHINNYELQHDNPNGEKYSLDISLFERLVKPKIGNSKVLLSTLKTQRRMHPSIAELVRVPLYPELQDHPSVSEYPEVDGMRDRLFWLDHQEKEDPRDPQSVSLSRTNTFEVDMIAALVSHLVRQGTYGNEDIAVITPYLGQLQKIKKRLAGSFEIVVGDRDLEDLEAQGLQDGIETSTDGQIQPQKTTLLNALRIASVDNFQGEEAKVIVISLVRSNDERKCGFLKTSNRINVLLSRARHGMYIIGNSQTASPVPMWSEVISILERSNKIGPSLGLCCPRHRDTPIEVSVPDDFVRLAPEGGCAKRCTSRLLCGHTCPNMCHSKSLHNAVRCLQRCQRVKKGCDHACPRVCGDQCEAECQVTLSNIRLPCGHIAKKLKCHEAQAPEKVSCRVKVQKVMPHCEHRIIVLCNELPLSEDYQCSATCKATLPCGHECAHECRKCNIRIDGQIIERKHGVCKTQCGRPFTTCRHSCKASCHGQSPCQLCTELCEVCCVHSNCGKMCHEPCAPCAEDCTWSCPHRGRCLLPCAAPCDLLPCSERCAKTLSCGHRCPSICGEACPSVQYCQLCAEPTIKRRVVDFILSSTFEEVDLNESPCIMPPCGHILTLESMDGHMSMSDYYIINDVGLIIGLKNSAAPLSTSGIKSCPTCRGPLRTVNRYSRIVRRALLDEATKKFIVWANARFVPLIKRMQRIEAELREETGDDQSASNSVVTEIDFSGLVHLKGSRNEQFSRIRSLIGKEQRYKSILQLRQEINKFLKQVDEGEQPFGRIYDLLQDARRHRGVNVELPSNADILQVRNRLLTTVLLIRCDYAILLNFVNAQRKAAARNPSGSQGIQIDLSVNRNECKALVAESLARKQPGSVVEGHIYWARFFALERGLEEPGEKMTQLLGEAKEHLQQARELCENNPGQTAGMVNEVEEVERMIRDSTFYMPVSNEEKAAVFAAMAQDFRGTGHWYYCSNNHLFSIGGCGAPMETSQCPQCGSPIGGHDHQFVNGVTSAMDLERQFGGLGIGS
jgi:AAA domain